MNAISRGPQDLINQFIVFSFEWVNESNVLQCENHLANLR